MHQDGRQLRLKPRVSGAMTGTRVAGVFGEFVVLDFLIDALQLRGIQGVDLSTHQLVYASWIDNLFSVAPTVELAVANLEAAEMLFKNRWFEVQRRKHAIHLLSVGAQHIFQSEMVLQ